MNENDDNETNIKYYDKHRNDSWAGFVLANIYYFIDVS